jgi:hypothetical protein
MDQRILLAAVLAVCICMGLIEKCPAWARSGPAAERVDQIMKRLKLTPYQKSVLLPVLTAEAPGIEAIRSDSSLSGSQKLEQFKALHSRIDPKVKSILNPRQYQKLQEIRERDYFVTAA